MIQIKRFQRCARADKILAASRIARHCIAANFGCRVCEIYSYLCRRLSRISRAAHARIIAIPRYRSDATIQSSFSSKLAPINERKSNDPEGGTIARDWSSLGSFDSWYVPWNGSIDRDKSTKDDTVIVKDSHDWSTFPYVEITMAGCTFFTDDFYWIQKVELV